jgi:WS/DGAT/MGAT family acyltransferase
MSRCDYERLSALDAAFLGVENPNSHMHVGAVALFDAAPLRASDGTLHIERIRHLVEAGFRAFPRYRQRLAWIPYFKRPVWVDDRRFNLHYHVRHTALPAPGDERSLKRMAARILSQPLDRGKPLWEMWVVEGVEGDRVALLTKIHHCMIDGISGADLIGSLLRISDAPTGDFDEPLPRWIPRPVPSGAELFRDEVRRIALEPLRATAAAARTLAQPRKTAENVAAALSGIGQAVAAGITPGSETPLNREIGPHRRFDWTSIELEAVKDVRARLGGHVNDVVLTVAAGAFGRFLRARGMRVEDLDFRAMVPVSVRKHDEQGMLGNKVTSMLAHLPIAERDPIARFARVTEMMARLKASPQAEGLRILEELADVTSNTMLSTLAKFSARNRAYNVVITNVPGPQIPLYLLGGRMRAIFPLVPLFDKQGVGIAVFSYDGRLYWGFNADYDEVPDLHDLVRNVEQEFADLAAASGCRDNRAAAEAPAAVRAAG